MPRGELEPSILAPFEGLGQAEKNKFTRTAKNLGITQEELLCFAVRAANAGILPIKKKVVYEIDLPGKDTNEE